MKKSAVEVGAASGIRAGPLQLTPSAELESTRSFAEQPMRKRQSCQTTSTVPSGCATADGSGNERRPAGGFHCTSETRIVPPKVAPPSIDRNAAIVPLRLFASTAITVREPSGRTSGCVPIRSALTRTGALHVTPPSSELCEEIRCAPSSV
jgi:hypothetical protein